MDFIRIEPPPKYRRPIVILNGQIIPVNGFELWTKDKRAIWPDYATAIFEATSDAHFILSRGKRRIPIPIDMIYEWTARPSGRMLCVVTPLF